MIVVLLALALVVTTTAQQNDGKIKLKCCTSLASPYVYENKALGDNFLAGLTIDYLGMFKEITGLQCIGELEVFRKTSNSTGWNDLLNNIAECTTENGRIRDDPECKCELGVGAWFENEDRTGVDFLPAYIHDSLRTMIHVNDTTTSIRGDFFLTSFSGIVWLCVFLLALFFMFLKLLDRRFAPPDDSFVPLDESKPRFTRVKHFLLKSKIPYRLRRATQSTFFRMIGQRTMDIQGDDSSTRQWVLNFAIALCGIFLILAYEATMTANLVQETIQSDFQNVDDFASCNIKANEICFVRGDITSLFWKNSNEKPDFRRNCKEEHPQDEYESYTAVIAALAAGKCTYVIGSGGVAGDRVNGRYCGELLTTGDPFFQSGLSFILPHGSPFKEKFRKATLQLKGLDSVPTLEQYFARSGSCDVSKPPRLTFRKLRVFFILAFSACVLIFLEMVLDPQMALKGQGDAPPGNQLAEVSSPGVDNS